MTVTLDTHVTHKLPAEPGPVDGLEFKTASQPTGSVVDVDETEGLVTAVVSVTGVVDEVDDNINHGAYQDTLKKRRPKVIWGHDWKSPIARVEGIAELKPGDKRLPTETKDGKPWPGGAGALVATMRFNLKSHAGREAFEAVRFYSETGECEWSVGYQVPSGKATKDKRGVRQIKAMDLFEISFVLFGAATQTGTLSLKSAVEALRERKQDGDGGEQGGQNGDDEVARLHRDAADEIDWDEVDEAAADTPDPGDDPDGEEGDEGGEGEPATVGAGEEGKFYFAPEVKRSFSAEQRRDLAKRGIAMNDGSFPIENETDLRNAIQAVGRASNPAKAKRHIKKRARALGKTDMLPDDWQQSGGKDADGADEDKARRRGDGNEGNAEALRDWYVNGEGAARIRWGTEGDFMRCVRIASDHMTRRQAKGFCNLRHRDALGVWAGQEHDKDGKALAYDPTLEHGPDAGHLDPDAVEEKHSGRSLPGSFEERLEAVRAAVEEELRGEPVDTDEDSGHATDRYEWDFVDIVGTWPDRVVATRVKFRPGPHQEESYEVPYDVGDDGTVELGEPQPVELSVTVTHTSDGEAELPDADEIPIADLLPIIAMVGKAADGGRTLLLENKAGRVLSSANEQKLRSAVEHLVQVLTAAGVTIAVPDTSAADGKVMLPPDDYARGLQVILDAHATQPA